MYDPVETDASMDHATRLFRACPSLVLLGGWAVYLAVRGPFLRATSRDYLRSRDVDLYLPKPASRAFARALRSMNFEPGAYPFRHTLILDRGTCMRTEPARARTMPLHELIYVDVDVFARRGVFPGAWVVEPALARDLERAPREHLGAVDACSAPLRPLARMKAEAYVERETEEKRAKDACDLYALLKYGGATPDEPLREALRRMVDSEHPAVVAEQLFLDRFAEGIVRRDIAAWLG